MVWLAGSRIARYANTIAERTGIGKAFLGMILLGGITSLPELAVTVTAALGDSAPLAVNNLLGGVAMQVAVLAVADAIYGKGAISAILARPVLLLQGILDILLLALIAGGVVVGDVGILGVGLWTAAVFVFFLLGLWLVKAYGDDPRWVPRSALEEGGDRLTAETQERQRRHARREQGSPLSRVVLRTGVAGSAILAGGYLLSRTGEALAEQTGLGTSFVGAVLVAISTSLPEVSTVIGSVRIGQYEMAFSDILGTNLFDLGMIFVIDLAYRGGPVLGEVGRFSIFAALLGIVVTAIYVAGLIERKDRAYLRMGVDSIAVVVVYVIGLFVFYQLR